MSKLNRAGHRNRTALHLGHLTAFNLNTRIFTQSKANRQKDLFGSYAWTRRNGRQNVARSPLEYALVEMESDRSFEGLWPLEVPIFGSSQKIRQ